MKIALVSPMLLPVPAIKGGAVEGLTTFLVEENERQRELDIDLYTIDATELDDFYFEKTQLIRISYSKLERVLQKLMNLWYRLTRQRKAYNVRWNKASKEIAKKQYDLIIVENNMFLYQLISKKTKNTLIYHMHNDFNDFDKTENNYKRIAQTAKKIIVVSEYIKTRVNQVCMTTKVQVLQNAIDANLFKEEVKEDLRQNYQIKNTDIVIGYVGRIAKEKGILELVKVFKELKTDRAIKLLIAGSQWYGALKTDSYIKEIIKESEEIKDKIIFTGYIPNDKMASVYGMMDVVVIPSLCEEAFGCVALEAMSMGIPCIIAKSGGLPEIVTKDFGYSIAKDENFIRNLKEKLEILIQEEDRRKAYGKKAKEVYANTKAYHKDTYYMNFLDIIKK